MAAEERAMSDNAHKVLIVYDYFKVPAGHDLVSDHFLAIGGRQHWRTEDLQDGIAEANRHGWIEKGDRGWRLTREGYEEAIRSRGPGRAV